jgi:hypothetical protein
MKKDPQLSPFLTLLWSFALVCLLVPAYAQYSIKSECRSEGGVTIEMGSEIFNDAPVSSAWSSSTRYTGLHQIEQELNRLRNSSRRLRALKRKIRRAKRILRRHENTLMAEIHDIEEYVKVDERLSQAKVMEYYKSINLLTSQLLMNRAKQRKLRRLERKARRLTSRSNYSNTCYSYSRSCTSRDRYRNHHESEESSPWMLAFMGLFGVNLLIGGAIAYKTLIQRS